jgi:hypothetical protein
MDQSMLAYIKGVIAFLLVAGTGMAAFRMWIRARARPHPELDRIVEGLRDDNEQIQADLQAHIAQLEERLDFVERRLVQGQEPARLPQSRARTPA